MGIKPLPIMLSPALLSLTPSTSTITQGWTQIFDGKTLQGWDGSPEVWHVEDGTLVAESSPEHPSGTTNIIWRGGQPANFELKLEMKLEGAGANGGIQYRSLNVPPSRQTRR